MDCLKCTTGLSPSWFLKRLTIVLSKVPTLNGQVKTCVKFVKVKRLYNNILYTHDM